MAQRIGDIEQWQLLGESALSFETEELEPRLVVLEINAPQQSQLYVSTSEGEELFIALVEGRDRVEFTIKGEFALFSIGGDVWFYTADGSRVGNHEIEPTVFTRIANRRDRNPNLEMMEFKMRQNIDRRMAELQDEAERRIADVERRFLPQRAPITPPELIGGAEGEEEGSTEPLSADELPGSGKKAKGKGKGGRSDASDAPEPATTADD